MPMPHANTETRNLYPLGVVGKVIELSIGDYLLIYIYIYIYIFVSIVIAVPLHSL